MLVGYFDYLIIGILVYINIRIWNNYKAKIVGRIGIALLFGLFLPLISMIIELSIIAEWTDSFEMVYTYLKFPIYWLIGILQLIIVIINLSVNNTKKQKVKDSI